MKYLQDSEDAKAIKKVRSSSSVTLLSHISLQPVFRRFLRMDLTLLSVFYPEFHELMFLSVTCFFPQSLKPQVERRRRERINRSLESLKTLLLQQQVKDSECRRSAEHADMKQLPHGAGELYV